MASNCPLSIFKRVLLVSAAGDRYVSPHSARIESPKSAFADKVNGTSNILIVETLQKKLEVNKTIVERYHVFHQNLPQGKTRFCSILTGPGQFWPALVDNWSILVDLNRFWSILVNLGRPWSFQADPDQSWSASIDFGRPWPILAIPGQSWSASVVPGRCLSSLWPKYFRYCDESNRPRCSYSCFRLSSFHFCISYRLARLQFGPRQASRFITLSVVLISLKLLCFNIYLILLKF